MRLTLHTDYALRLLMYLAVHPDERVRLRDVSAAYGISHNHLTKIVPKLVTGGYVETIAGRNGGMWLSMNPAEINIGALVEQFEPDFALVACMEDGGHCVVAPACKLYSVLDDARRVFLDHLRQFTLEDVLVDRRLQLSELLGAAFAAEAESA